jgi:hypothetical protein
MNAILLAVKERPRTFAAELMALYRGECAG